MIISKNSHLGLVLSSLEKEPCVDLTTTTIPFSFKLPVNDKQHKILCHTVLDTAEPL